MSVRMVNGYVCRNCADEELAKKGLDPAHPRQAFAGKEAFVSASDAARNRGQGSVEASKKGAELGVNRPESAGDQGRKLNIYA
ncbi:MAG TPA: hypothetical protein VGC79_14590 [Polyangiaceae bacterium]